MSDTYSAPSTPLRVLVVENDPRWRHDHTENLKAWGYQFFIAEPDQDAPDVFRSLRENAIAKARRHRCHLALVDMRLKNDDDPADTSGLDLVPELAPTVSIIVSSYGDVRTVRAALKSPPEVPERAYDFVRKEDGPEGLKPAIEDAASEIWCRRDVEIVWPAGLTPADLVGQLLPEEAAVPLDQIEDLLRRLFPDANRITLEPFDAAEPEINRMPKAPTNALLLLMFEDDPSKIRLVKLGTASYIEREASNYHHFLEHLPIRRLPLADQRVLWDIGALVYDLAAVSRKVETLASVLTRPNVADLQGLLRDIVGMLRALQDDQNPLDTGLFDDYLIAYRDTLEELAQDADSVDIPGLNVRLAAPIRWVLDQREQSHLPGLRQAVGHRQLLTDNILVDADGHVFLINFENMGTGHVLQDVALLEVDLFIRMTSNLDPAVFLELAVVAYQGEENRRWMRSTVRIDNNPEAQRVLDIVLDLRRQAFETIWFPDRREYFWGLLLSTVKWMVLKGPQHPYYKRAELLGAVLCERIASKDDAWPTASLHGIELLSPAELDDKRNEINRLRQQLRLLEIEQRSYGEKVSPNVRKSISDIESRLSKMGLTLNVATIG